MSFIERLENFFKPDLRRIIIALIFGTISFFFWSILTFIIPTQEFIEIADSAGYGYPIPLSEQFTNLFSEVYGIFDGMIYMYIFFIADIWIWYLTASLFVFAYDAATSRPVKSELPKVRRGEQEIIHQPQVQTPPPQESNQESYYQPQQKSAVFYPTEAPEEKEQREEKKEELKDEDMAQPEEETNPIIDEEKKDELESNEQSQTKPKKKKENENTDNELMQTEAFDDPGEQPESVDGTPDDNDENDENNTTSSVTK